MRGKLVLYRDFRGGVNTDVAPYNLGDTECRDARNVQSTSRGAVRKRDGSTQFSVPAAALTSLFAGKSPNFMVGSDGANLYSISTAGTVTSIASALTAGSRWEWVLAPAQGGQGPFYGVNGTDLRQWTGSGASAAWTAATGTLPAGKFLAYHGNRVWVAGVTADPSGLYFSNLANPRDWPAANIVRFDPEDGEVITGIGSIGPMLLVFKASKTFLVYNLDTGANRLIARNAGCVANRSIVETPQGTFFLSKDQGVMVASQSSVQKVSDNIRPTITALSDAARSLAAGAVFNDHYYLSVPETASGNSLLLDFDMHLRSWWLHSLGMTQLVVWEPTAGRLELHGAPRGVARTDRLFVPGSTTDPAGAFSSYWNGPFLTFGKPSVRKRCREIHFDGQGRIRVSLTKDFNNSAYLVGDRSFIGAGNTFGGTGNYGGDSLPYGGAKTVDEAHVYTPGVARAWSVTFGNETADPFEIESFTMSMTERTE